MKHVVSVSLGSSKRDKVVEAEILGVPFRIERRGTDGDKARFRQLLTELDGKVDAIGVGGCDLHLWAQGRRYTFRDVQRLVAHVQHTPVVDGSGLKNTLERWAVGRIEQKGILDWSQQNVLLVSALDRFGMAEALAERAREIVFGDALFALGVPLPVRNIRTLASLARLILPVVVRLPFEWVYPTGAKQERNTPRWERYFRWADVIAGDWHYIRRYAPPQLRGKVVLTNTVRKADVAFLRERGAALLLTTTPVFGEETFATNVLEAVIVALTGSDPDDLRESDYHLWLSRLGWDVGVVELTSASASACCGG
ncbi:MAG: quinate 5-dehydrogenase [bacterium]|nr:quinate 5-dehydrogenase [bacterium]